MLFELLADRQRQGSPIRVGLIGAGTFGSQIISQVCHMQGMTIAAIADLQPERGVQALRRGGIPVDTIVASDEPRDVERALEARRPVVTRSVEALVHGSVDVVVEATGNPEVGARHAMLAIEARKHLVMVTVEADVVVGTILRKKAEQSGVMYSLAYGDEPALAIELCDWAKCLGFRIVAAGKGTRFIPEFRLATPDDVPRLYGFEGKDYNAQVFCSFLDGTKHAIEVTALANAMGLSVDVPGMHFPAAELADLPDLFSLKQYGGLLEREGVVEAVSAMRPDQTYVQRNLRGGVFAVVATDDHHAADSLATYGQIIGMMIGKRSKNLMIYRPQHFVGHEVPIGIARMMLLGQTCGGPIGAHCDVVAKAKRPLEPGTVLDGEGGFLTYGSVELGSTARERGLVPIGLSLGAKVIKPIPVDGNITHENSIICDSLAAQLRRLQDALPVAGQPQVLAGTH